MLMLTKMSFCKRSRLAVRKGLAIRNDSVLSNLFLIESSTALRRLAGKLELERLLGEWVMREVQCFE